MMVTRSRSVNSVEDFDESSGYDDESGIHYAPNLTEEERRQATALYRLFNELWGVCVVKGDPGNGKDLFGNYITYKLKTYFPHKRILRDEKPRKLYGGYAGLFNENILQDSLSKMRTIAKGIKTQKELDVTLDNLAEDWVSGSGEVLLKNSVLYLTEFWRYCYNREPHNPMNKTMGAIHKVKRHLDCLILGTIQIVDELDKKTAKQWIDWIVTCVKSVHNPTGFYYYVQKVKYDRRADTFTSIGRPFPIAFDAGKPRTNLGDGRILLRKPNYRPETEEERVVLNVIKAGADNYEEIVNILEEDGDMSEQETLDTLKELGLKMPKRRPKLVLDYPCYFKLYNSKSAPQIRSAVRVED